MSPGDRLGENLNYHQLPHQAFETGQLAFELRRAVEAGREPPVIIPIPLVARVNIVGDGMVIAAIPISDWLDAQAAGPGQRLIVRDVPEGAFLLVGERAADKSWTVDPTELSEVGLMFASRPLSDISILLELQSVSGRPLVFERTQITLSSFPAETVMQPAVVAFTKRILPQVPDVAMIRRAPDISKTLVPRTATTSATSVSTTVSTVDVGGVPASVHGLSAMRTRRSTRSATNLPSRRT